MTDIKLTDVVFDSSIYPREKWNSGTVNTYIDALKGDAKFPPIILEKDTNRIIDGVHRWKAYQKYLIEYTEATTNKNKALDGWALAQDSISVEFIVIPDDVPVKLFAAGFSVRHGLSLTRGEREKIAREIFEENPDFTLATIGDFLGVSDDTAGGYVSDITARRKEQRRTIAFRLHRLGWTQQEIADKLGFTEGNYRKQFFVLFPDLVKGAKNLLDSGIPHLEVAERFNMPLILIWAIDLDGRDDAEQMSRFGIKVQPYDVWNFTKCSDLFGTSHPGRIPGKLIAHVLYFFTEPGMQVFDPMVGSGTTLDVCLAMGRKCYGYDIDDRHERLDIIAHDMNIGWPSRIKKANLIFWDPPYFEKMDKSSIGKEGYIDGSISALSRQEYLSFFNKRLTEAKSLVKKGTKLAFLMSDWDDNTNEREGIFVWDYADIIRESGWKLIRHIQVPLSTQQVHPDIVTKFRKSKRLARLERYLLIAEA